MKKILFLILTITTLLANTHFFTEKNNALAVDFLEGGQRQVVYVDIDDETLRNSLDTIIAHLNEFSQEHQISIAKFEGFMNLDVDIYMTNIENNPYIHLTSGDFPSGNRHLSNRRFYSENTHQSGQFSFPVSNFDIRIYDFEQVRNIGFMGHLHLIGADEETAKLFLDEFSVYGDTSFSEDIYFVIADTFIQQTTWDDTSIVSIQGLSPLLTAVLFSLLILFIGTCFFLLKYRRRLLLEQLWGYSSNYGFYSIPKLFFPFYCWLNVGIVALFTAILVINNQTNDIAIHLPRILVINLAIGGLFYLFLLVGILLTKKFSNFAISLKGKSFFERMQWVSFGSKALVSILLLTMLLSSFTTLNDLRAKYFELAYWRQTENIYMLWAGTRVGIIGVSEDQMSTMITEDGEEIEVPAFETINPEKEHEFNKDLASLVAYLQENNDAFILNNHQFIRRYDEEKGWTYGYELDRFWRDETSWLAHVLANPDMFHPLYHEIAQIEGLMDMGDRHLYLDTRYLERNPIFSNTGENVLDLLVDDPYILNVLVPESYRPFEEDLMKYFLWEFYWYRVDEPNLHNENLGLPLIETTLDDLSVHFIYTKTGQSYFSFDRDMGDEQSLIWDPLVMVHNEHGIAPNQLAARLSHLYFTNQSRGQALESIRPFLEQEGIEEVHSAISIFAQGNDELVQIQWQMFQQTLNLIMLAIFSFMLCIMLIWSYYSANAYKTNLQFLFGYSNWECNREIIISVLVANIVGAGILIAFNGFQPIIVAFVAVLSAVDLLIINRLSKSLIKNNVAKVLKGGEL